jgi:8-oxo-dGTP pyrophosphatase MutT (NUDIX family)
VRWEVLKSEITYRCRIFSVRCDRSRSLRSGQTWDFHVLETNDWVNVVPLTREQQVVMVRQFRHGIGDLTLEVPAGLIDPGDRSPAQAAMRELREETGYVAREIVPLGTVHPNPAIMNNRCHMFVAREVELKGAPQWDGTEELVVESVPLGRVPELVVNGTISNALTLVAFHLLDLRMRGWAPPGP